MPGSRTADNENAAAWVATTGERASHGTFADAVAHGELHFNCAGGLVSPDALRSVRPEDITRTTLVDVAHTLDTSSGSPVVVTGPDSLGERIQREFPTHEWSRR